MPPAELCTPRLRLRQWRDEDREPFASLNADPRVMEHFPGLVDRATSDSIIDKLSREIARRGWSFWAAELRETGEFIGFVGLQIPSVPLPFAPCVEIGWRLAHAYWHRGFATEAAREALRFGFEQLQLTEIVSYTALDNHRSAAVMQRLGMVRDPHSFEHPGVPLGHRVREHCLYRLAREDWKPCGDAGLSQTPCSPTTR